METRLIDICADMSHLLKEYKTIELQSNRVINKIRECVKNSVHESCCECPEFYQCKLFESLERNRFIEQNAKNDIIDYLDIHALGIFAALGASRAHVDGYIQSKEREYMEMHGGLSTSLKKAIKAIDNNNKTI